MSESNKVKLVEICNPKQWKTISSHQLKNEGYPVYGANGIIGYSDEYNHLMPTVTITCRGATCGNIHLTKEKSYVNGNAMCLDELCDRVNLKYLYYALKAYDFNKIISGSAQPQITRIGLQKVEINLVSHQKQTQIVAQMDLLEKVILAKRTQLSKLDELVKSRFIEMFGDLNNYSSYKLSDVCLLITDGTHQSPKFLSSGVPFLLVSNLVNNEISYDTNKFISKETYNELIKRTPVGIGDILFSIVGSYGHVAVVKFDKKFCFQRHIAYIKPDLKKLNSIYLQQALLSDNAKYQIEKRVKGIAQKTLNLSELKKIIIPVPTMELQNEFADFVKSTDKSKAAIQKSLDELETLKKSLMQQYFG